MNPIPTPPHIAAVADELAKACGSLLEYFNSCNRVPIEKATIRADSAEVLALRAALARYAAAPERPKPSEQEPIETVRYWLNAYSDPASGEHFHGHGMVARMLRDYLAMREWSTQAQPAGEVPPLPEPIPGAVWEDEGVSLIRRGGEDERCKARGSERLVKASDVLALAAGMAAQPAAGEPVAWAHFAENGNIRIWTSAPGDVQRLAKQVGFPLVPLYTAHAPFPGTGAVSEAWRTWQGKFLLPA